MIANPSEQAVGNKTTERAGTAEGTKIHLKADFALPTSETNSTPLPGTLKPA